MKRTHLLPPLAVIALFFGAIFPTLHWREFTDGGENGVAGAVLELRRGGPWLVPTLHAEQRTKKPPLATWVAAKAARPDTVARLSEPDPSVRHAAYRDLARQIRWPSLLTACLMLAAVYAQGAVVDGPSLGFAAALICGTTLLWLDLGYLATTDVPLALWVNVANVFLAAAVLRGKWWMGCCGAGV